MQKLDLEPKDELDIKQIEKEFSKEDHYFKVDKRILEISDKAISKKGILEYTLHCRRLNPEKNLGCSMAGANDARKCLGLGRDAHRKALEELEYKYLVTQRPDVKTGYLKTTAIEVLAFPKYDKKTRQFLKDATRVHNHRTYKDVQYINIPAPIVDKECLKELSKQSLFAIFWLYGETNLIEYRGVNYNFIYSFYGENEKGYERYCTFGGGFSKEIYNRPCLEAISPNRYSLPDIKFQGNFNQAINELVERNLFEWVPVLLKQDKEDLDISEIEGEIFKGLVGFEGNNKSKNLYLFVEPPKNIKVIWILRPNFFVKTPEYEQFRKITEASYNYEYNKYHYFDVSTSKEKKKEYIKDEYFKAYLCDWKPKHYNKVKHLLEDSNGENVEEIINILPNFVFRGFKKYKELEEV